MCVVYIHMNMYTCTHTHTYVLTHLMLATMSLTNKVIKVTQLGSSGINQNPSNQNSVCMTTYYTTAGEKQSYKPYNSGVAGGGHHS